MVSRERVRRLVEASGFQRAITTVILINAVTLGAETSTTVMNVMGDLLHALDTLALSIFVGEALVKLYAYGLARYFRDPWNCFDFLVVAISLVPAAGGASVVRAFRVLRVLRLISTVPSMRRVVGGLLGALPGMGSIVALLGLVLYVAAVMSTNLFGPTAPEYFGDIGTSLWTLFQIMTGEAWPDIAREVMGAQPASWIFFLVYILISTFVVLNLFLAVMVSAMEETRLEQEDEERAAERQEDKAIDDAILAELTALRREVEALRRTRENPLSLARTPDTAGTE